MVAQLPPDHEPLVQSTNGLLGNALVFSRYLAVESLDDRYAIVAHMATGARLKISRGLYDLMRNFDRPKRLHDVVEASPGNRLVEQIGTLAAKGFLVDATTREAPGDLRRTGAVPYRLFNCPSYDASRAADVCVAGIPYDLTSRAGCREAPTIIRQRSLDFSYQLDFLTGQPKGWFDADRAQRILAGVTFSDCGDVFVQYGEAQQTLFERVQGLIEEVVELGSLPVVLGGDNSVSYPVVTVLQQRRPMVVLQLDAHTDFDPSVPLSIVSAPCVGRRLWRLPGVRRLIQVGHRGYTVNPKVQQALPNIDIITVEAARRMGLRQIVDSLPPDLPVYVSIDMSVLDPTCAPASTMPVPGGFLLEEVKTILQVVGEAREVIGIDLVEFDPDRDVGSITSIVACHLLLAALGSAMTRRGRSSS